MLTVLNTRCRRRVLPMASPVFPLEPMISLNASRSVFRLWCWLCLLVCPIAAQPAESRDFSGFWTGTVRHEQSVYDIGFEFRRDADGRWLGRQWYAVLHQMGTPMGVLAETPGGLRHGGAGLELHFTPEGIEGVINGQDPLTLRRCEALPASASVPVYPAGPRADWTCTLGAPVWGSPTVCEDGVAVADALGRVHLLELGTGTSRWVRETGAAIHGDVLFVKGSAYVYNDAGRCFRLCAGTGEIIWQRELGGGAVVRHPPAETEYSYDYRGATPVLADGTLYVTSADGTLWALDAESGTTRWQVRVGGLVRTRVAVTGDLLVVTTWAGEVLALGRGDGAVRWRFASREAFTADPVVVGDAVFVSSRDSKLYRLRVGDGSVDWTYYHAGSWVESAPRVVDGLGFIGSSDLRLVRAFAPETGAPVWEIDVLGWSWGTPAVSDVLVFAGAAGAVRYPISMEGGVVALDRATGKPRWRVAIGAMPGAFATGVVGSPVVAGPRVICAGLDGVVYAFPVVKAARD